MATAQAFQIRRTDIPPASLSQAGASSLQQSQLLFLVYLSGVF